LRIIVVRIKGNGTLVEHPVVISIINKFDYQYVCVDLVTLWIILLWWF